MKHCRKCDQTLPLDAFWRQGGKSSGRQSYCIECTKADRQARKLARRDSLKRNYGMSPSDEERLWEEQGGLCAVCDQPMVRGARGRSAMCIDHDHESGRVRAMLCNECNTALGMLAEDPDRIFNLLAYVLADRKVKQCLMK